VDGWLENSPTEEPVTRRAGKTAGQVNREAIPFIGNKEYFAAISFNQRHNYVPQYAHHVTITCIHPEKHHTTAALNDWRD
jgi:hypothetical protein